MKFGYKETVDFYEVLRVNLLYDPTNLRNLILYGALQFVRFHQYRQAITTLKEALTQDESSMDARFWLGICYCHTNDYSLALKIINAAIGIDPSRADCLSLKAYILWDEKKDIPNSIACLTEALFLAPFWPMLHVELISFLYTSGHYKEALQQIQTAQELTKLSPLKPNNPVEEYYEKWVTGRSWVDLEDKLLELRLKIEQSM
jgi:tetratricopeptide (TPR) repeat protein